MKRNPPGTATNAWHYFVLARFCNITVGNEKGHVERSVEYVRRSLSLHPPFFQSEGGAETPALEVECPPSERAAHGQKCMGFFALERPLLYGHPGRLPMTIPISFGWTSTAP
jgi:hypothetical protein